MKLTITRKQTEQTDRRGRSEGVLYGFSCRLALDPHESELVEKYDQTGYPIKMLMMDDVRDYRPSSDKDRILTVARLRGGLVSRIEVRHGPSSARPPTAATKKSSSDPRRQWPRQCKSRSAVVRRSRTSWSGRARISKLEDPLSPGTVPIDTQGGT